MKNYLCCINRYDHIKLQRVTCRTDEQLGIRNDKFKNEHKTTKEYSIKVESYDISKRKDCSVQKLTFQKDKLESTSNQNYTLRAKHTNTKVNEKDTSTCQFIQEKDNKLPCQPSTKIEYDRVAKENREKEPGDGEESGTKYLQILFYYVQDAVLFKVKLPTDNIGKAESTIVKILQFSPEVFAVYQNYSDICFTYGGSAVSKIVMKAAFGPCVMVFLLLVYYIFKWTSRWNFYCLSACHLISGYLIQTLLLVFLMSYQQIVTGIFTLVQCVKAEEQSVLYVQGEIICYTWWQICIKVFILLNILPLLLIISHLPFHIKDKTISTTCFLFTCMFPIPLLIHVSFLRIYRKKHLTNTNNKTRNESENLCRESIIHILLEHYRCLTMFGIRFTWLGVHKLYRLLLVVCKTYILEPVVKLSVMSFILILVTISNGFLKPYKDIKANKTATLSYMGNICIAIINTWKTGLVAFGCKTNCSLKIIMFWYLELCKSILLIWLPLVAILTWVSISVVIKCRSKFKKAR